MSQPSASAAAITAVPVPVVIDRASAIVADTTGVDVLTRVLDRYPVARISERAA